MRGTDLSDRVVAVAKEDPFIEASGALPFGAVERPAALGDVLRELLEEKPAKGARVPRVAGEERPLDRLGQADEAEDGPVEVGEVRAKDRLLFGGEGLDRVAHLRIVATLAAAAPRVSAALVRLARGRRRSQRG